MDQNLTFVATSGNETVARFLQIENRVAIDFHWDHQASQEDQEEAMVWAAMVLFANTGQSIVMESVVEQDPVKRASTYRKHLGGGIG